MTSDVSNLANVVRFWAHWKPDHDSIVVVDGPAVTWADLHERTSRLANGLARAGIGAGDRVGILSGNCLEYLELAIAGYKLGSILVPLNVRLTAHELGYIIEHAGCRAVVADAALAALAVEALTGVDRDVDRIGLADGFGTHLTALRADDHTDPMAPVVADDVAYICYTSGTTGAPKGAMLSHGNVLAMAQNRVFADDMTTAARVYLPFPLSFTGGLVSVFAPAHLAGSTLVLDSAVDATRALRVLQDEAITTFGAVPVIWEMLLRHPNFTDHDLSALVNAASGGAAVPEPLLVGLQAAGIPMSQAYGLTEGGGMNTWLRAEDASRKLGSCGQPMMHTRLRTVDPESRALVDVQAGEVGELIISGPEVMLGYWENPGATAEALVDGWLRTGDLARIDEEGYVFIVDRSKDMLISGGLNVYPAEIESVLAGIDGVAECAVIGVPDDRWGETAVALIGAAPSALLDPAAIATVCREQLADYKRPRYIVIREQPLPRGMSGKVLKRELRDEYADPASLGPAVH